MFSSPISNNSYIISAVSKVIIVLPALKTQYAALWTFTSSDATRANSSSPFVFSHSVT
jgi:hypothetical protein